MRQYQKDVPYAQVAWELFYSVLNDNCWFKGPHDGSLTAEECDSIAAFRQLFKDRVDELPMEKEIEKLFKSKGWQEIQAQAQDALAVMKVTQD